MPQPGKPWLATREEVAATKANAQAEMRRLWETDPSYRSSGVFEDRDGRIQTKRTGMDTVFSILDKTAVPAAYALTGLGAASGLGLFGGAAGAAGGSGASVAPALPAVISGLPGAAGAAGAAGAGAGAGAAGAGAGGVMSAINNPWLKAGVQLVSLLGGRMAGQNASKNANRAAGGARLQELLPLIQRLIQQQQSQSAQNYAYQQQQHAANMPLQDTLRQMAYGLMPTRYRSSMTLPPPQAYTPPTPPAPVEPPSRNPPTPDMDRARPRRGY